MRMSRIKRSIAVVSVLIMALVHGIVVPLAGGWEYFPQPLALAGEGDQNWRSFPRPVIHLDSHEELTKFEPIRVIQKVGKLVICHYFLFFERDVKHPADLEPITFIKNEEGELLVGYWQHGKLVVYKYPKHLIPDQVDVYVECGGHAMLAGPGISEGGMAEVCWIAPIFSALHSTFGLPPLPPWGPTDGKKILVEGKDYEWKDYESIGDCLRHLKERAYEIRKDLGRGMIGSRTSLEKFRFLPLDGFTYYPEKSCARIMSLARDADPKNPVSIDLYKEFSEITEQEKGGIDFTSIQLAYISEHSESRARGELEERLLDFQYVFRATEAKPGDEISDLEEAKVLSLLWFLVGLSLPNHKFWVNLNPWEPERIIDEDLGRTDVGRIMLEADFQMKKDVCKYENPGESDIGEKFWSLLDRKGEELVEKCMNMYPGEIKSVYNVLFTAATRHWIVPDTITGYGDGDELYIANATLDIYSEPVYEHSTFEIVNQLEFISEDCREYLSEAAKKYGRYAKEIQEEMILPLVVEEVNTNSKYSDLRQVYASLALAQWYKSHYRFGEHLFSGFIDSEDLENLKSMVAWDPEEIWKEYVKSYEEGEFHYEKEYEEGGYIITCVYTAGGVEFQNIENKTSIVGSIDSEIREMILETTSNPLVKMDEWYYFDDYIGISEQTLKMPSTYHSDRFSINYPKTWSVTEEGTLVTFTSPEESIMVHIKSEKLDSSPTIEKYLQSRKVALASQLSNYSFIRDGVIEIDGKEGRTLVYTYTSESQVDLLMKVKEVILKGEEHYWIISYTAPEGIFNTVNEEYFEEMVGSYNLMERRTLPIGLMIEKYFVVIVIATLIMSGFVYAVVSATRKSAPHKHL